MTGRGAVLVTGSTGFVGSALVGEMKRRGIRTRIVIRSGPTLERDVVVEDIGPDTDWSAALDDCNCVVHLAARVHLMNDKAFDPHGEFRRINAGGTLNLARQGVFAGVRRFVYVSSIKVNGEGTLPGQPYTAADLPAPADPYGISKREAEDGLRQLAAESGMELVIIRPPLVYGPGVKANFLAMMDWLYKGVPLPLGAIHNRRSLVALDSLVDLIVTCISHSAAANQTFLVSDGEDLSTTNLLRRMGTALGKPARLLPLPAWLLTAGARMIGKSDLSQRLCGSLQVDISKNKRLLGWVPPVKVNDALRLTAEHYLRNRSR